MFKNKLTEETRYGLIVAAVVLMLPILMIVANLLLGGDSESTFLEKQKDKTVILTQPKQGASPPAPVSGAVINSVRDAIKKGNYSTAYMEINKVSKSSPEYEELNKIVSDEARRRSKAPGLRKEGGASPAAPIRYIDETTPRTRNEDAIYIYFVDISGTLLPRLCIQAAAKRSLKISAFTITADNKAMVIHATDVRTENTEKGVSEWYDVPLDRHAYETVQAMIKAKKVTLTITGSGGKTTRAVSENEKKGFRQILDGYTALGGKLDYLQESRSINAPAVKKQPSPDHGGKK